jgi:CheY-like chemotaxis protein
MKTLLLVDDELGMVESLSFLLEREGYRVVSAANGRDGLQRLREAPVDLVIVDVMMPILGGMDMLRMMRATPEHASTPAVLISAAPERVSPSPDERRSDAAPAPLYQVFLRKPFDLADLLSTVERFVGAGERPTDFVD